MAARKAITGDQSENRARTGRAAAVGVGHAGHRPRGVLCRQRGLAQFAGRRFTAIGQIEIGTVIAEQRLARYQPAIGVLGGEPRHFDCTLRQRPQSLGREIAGVDRSGAAADEDAQTDLLAFGAFDLFQRAEPDADAFGRGGTGNRIGFIRAHLAREIDEVLAAGKRRVGSDHGRVREWAVMRAR